MAAINTAVQSKKAICANIKGACSDPQPHPPDFFQTYGDFGTRS